MKLLIIFIIAVMAELCLSAQIGQDSIVLGNYSVDLIYGTQNIKNTKIEFTSSPPGHSIGFGFNVMQKNHFFRYYFIHLENNNLIFKNFPEAINDLGMQFGLYRYRKHSYSDLSIGLCISKGNIKGKYLGSTGGGGWFGIGHDQYEPKSFFTVGLPVEAKFMYRYKYIGFGPGIYINLNSKLPYWSANMSVKVFIKTLACRKLI